MGSIRRRQLNHALHALPQPQRPRHGPGVGAGSPVRHASAVALARLRCQICGAPLRLRRLHRMGAVWGCVCGGRQVLVTRTGLQWALGQHRPPTGAYGPAS